ncbi:MAG: fluoride efflux transporter CrcB [Armatimonadota bacterium]
MRSILPILLIALGGALGALARYGLGGLVQGNRGHFPYGTLVVNILGCLVMGVLMGLVSANIAKPEHRTFLGIGFLGAFTTFSTFSFEALNLFQNHDTAGGLLYIGLTMIGCLAAVTVGYLITSAVWR